MALREFAERHKLRAIAAWFGLGVGTLLGWSWPWGLLFLAATIGGVRAGQTELVEPVRRDENPAVFWLVSGSWVLLSLALVGLDLYPWIAHAAGSFAAGSG